MALTQSLTLDRDPETEGFFLHAGETWIYPTNYPTREYQFNIIEKALLKNTLVSLPTGLGKTFIAAVVMYNFYRWYPNGKIIFMAPTRPLVKQQVDACYNITAIPQDVTAELTGTKSSTSRSNIWVEKRVFFVTPQVLQNDLETVSQLGSQIKCLVFDEAHRAKGNHAYCQVIRKLIEKGQKYFRVLALSATPGSNVEDVLEVVNNLLISHLEFRTEESVDVKQYVFQRSLETVVVPLGEKLYAIKEEYLKVLEQYASTLVKFKIIQGNCASLTKGKIFMIMKEYQNKNRGIGSSNYSEIMRCLNICVTLYHGLELLVRHGLRSFLSFFDEHIEKPLLRGNTYLRQILEKVRNHLGPIPQIEVLPDGTYPEIPSDIKFGHPKHYKLKELLISHFTKKEHENSSRVIVFFEYRESVMEANILLLQSRPLIKPRIFLGQGAGITQKTQLGVVKAFREGKCNTLLSTCIGEEGLDVGEVDLIVCFDVSTKSPIRMIQRMGRTGRKREGSVIILLTEGKEQQTLKDCLVHKNNMSTYVLGSSYLKNNMYGNSPRMVPSNLSPRCEKMFITVKAVAKKVNTLDKIFRSGSSKEIVFSQDEPVPSKFADRIPDVRMKCFTGEKPETSNVFSKHIEKIRSFQNTCFIGHSDQTMILNSLLNYADSKRFNIPVGPEGTGIETSNKFLKQGDIRSLFKNTATASSHSSQTSQSSSQTSTEKQFICVVPLDEIIVLLSDYFYYNLAKGISRCTMCPGEFTCDDMASSNSPETDSARSSQTVNLTEDVINSITLKDIDDYLVSLGVVPNKHDVSLADFIDDSILNEIQIDELMVEKNDQTFAFEAPSNYSKLADSFGIAVASQTQESPDENELLEFFKLNSLDSLFECSIDSSQDTIVYTPQQEEKRDPVPGSISEFCDLSYFGLTDIVDEQRKCDDSQPENEIELSPTIGSSRPKRPSNESKISITQMIDLLADSSRGSVNQSDASTLKSSRLNTHQRKIEVHKSSPTPEPAEEPFSDDSSADEFQECTSVKRKSKQISAAREFLDLEAEVSTDNIVVSDDENDDTRNDVYEKSFVNDKTQIFNTQMHAVYLRSVKSPARKAVFPRPNPPAIADVFSQAPQPDETNDYVEDSFCVDSAEEESFRHESVLDILEAKLKEQRKRKKNCARPDQLKRRRIKQLSSDESDD